VTAYGKFSPINIQLSLGLSQHPHEYLKEVSGKFQGGFREVLGRYEGGVSHIPPFPRPLYIKAFPEI